MPDYSTKIVDLCSHLGYHAEYPPRDIKTLQSAVDAFYVEYTATGNRFPRNRTDLGSATLAARDFLEEENRGPILFASAHGVDGPSWPRDQEM